VTEAFGQDDTNTRPLKQSGEGPEHTFCSAVSLYNNNTVSFYFNLCVVGWNIFFVMFNLNTTRRIRMRQDLIRLTIGE
jgi:hypothetical protein